MEKKELQEFIYFFTHNKSLTRAQQQKRDALFARDYVNNASDLEPPVKNEIDNSLEGEEHSPKAKKRKECATSKYREKYISPKNLQLFLKHPQFLLIITIYR